MDYFVIEREFRVAMVVEARREFDRIRVAAAARPAADVQLVLGLYLAGRGRSVIILRAHQESVVEQLLAAAGLRVGSIQQATAFPSSPGFRPE